MVRFRTASYLEHCLQTVGLPTRPHPAEGVPMRSTRVAAVAVYGFILSCVNPTGIEASFHTDMSGANEVPPITSSGTATFAADLNDQSLLLYDVTFAALTGVATQAHLHGPANGTQVAPILVDLDAP